jgi:hypothetical protein
LVCIYFFTNNSGSSMKSSVNASLTSIVNEVNNINSQMQLPALPD